MIGIFDSGLGGLTVVRALMRRLPDCPPLYFGDTARTPYGSKSPETIQRYAIEDTEFLVSRGAKVIIVACNTVSSTAMPTLREQFPDVRFYEVITPAASRAVSATKTKRIGVVGTRATIASSAYTKAIGRIDPSVEVITQACPLIVPMIEEGWHKSNELRSIIKTYLEPLSGVDTLILGCTHYPIVRDVFADVMGPAVSIIDCADVVTEQFVSDMMHDTALAARSVNHGSAQFFVSDVTPHFQTIASEWLGTAITLASVS
ncbi:MAG: glutamate racemase [bacterium]|nr:glutamate racemase [bacterium]